MAGELVRLMDEESLELSLSELCRVCSLTADEVIDYVDYCVIEPHGEPAHWRFNSVSIRRVQKIQRLQRDLGVNLAAGALVLDLLDELELLRGRVRRYEP